MIIPVALSPCALTEAFLLSVVKQGEINIPMLRLAFNMRSLSISSLKWVNRVKTRSNDSERKEMLFQTDN